MALSDNLISYWSLDEASGDAIDAHGTNDLTDTNTVGAATGKVDGARDFEESASEYFSHADNSDLSTGDIDFTFACWVNAESFTGSNQRIICKINNAVTVLEYDFYYRGSESRFYFDVYNGSSLVGRVAANTFGAPSTATWYFVVGRHRGGATNEIDISVNDGGFDSAATTGAPADTAAPFSIGSLAGLAGTFWDGLIDEVAFWKRSISDAEVTELYNSGNGRDYAYVSGGGGGGLAIPVARHHYMMQGAA